MSDSVNRYWLFERKRVREIERVKMCLYEPILNYILMTNMYQRKTSYKMQFLLGSVRLTKYLHRLLLLYQPFFLYIFAIKFVQNVVSQTIRWHHTLCSLGCALFWKDLSLSQCMSHVWCFCVCLVCRRVWSDSESGGPIQPTGGVDSRQCWSQNVRASKTWHIVF